MNYESSLKMDNKNNKKQINQQQPVQSFHQLLRILSDNFDDQKVDKLYNNYVNHLRHIYQQQTFLYQKTLQQFS